MLYYEKGFYMYKMGEPRIKNVAMPKDTNQFGSIFGGWIMSQIDLAGFLAVRDVTQEKVVTVAVNSIVFKDSVEVGDIVSCYAKVVRIGTTSVQTDVEVVAERMAEYGNVCIHVTSASVTYVQVDDMGNKKPLCTERSILTKLNLDTIGQEQ